MRSTKPSLLQRFGPKRHLHAEICEQRERLYRIAWSWCHDQYLADDLVQETQIRGLQKIESLRDESRLPYWLTSIMANLYRDHFRKNKEETGQELPEISDENTPETHVDRSEMVQQTRLAIASLNDDQRQVITLIDLAEFSYADTASILNIPVGTVMSRLSRARKNLRTHIEQLTDTRPKVVPLRSLS